MINKRNKVNELLNCTTSSIIDNTTDAIFIKDSNLVYVDVSKHYAESLADGSSPEELIGKTDYDIFESRQLAEKYRSDDKALFKSHSSMIEYLEEYPEKDGKKRYGITTKYAIFDEDDNPVGIFGQTRDITDQVELEHLEKSQMETINLQKKIFKALQNIYYSCLFWDLRNDRYFEVAEPATGTQIIPKRGNLSEGLKNWMNYALSAEWREECSAFFNLKTLPERLKNEGTQVRELFSNEVGWSRVSLIPVDFDQEGNPVSCLWVGEDINREKGLELQNQEELKVARREAETDKLTGLTNRGGGEKALQEILDDFERGLLLLFDVDKFKMINDDYGHAAGDVVLRKIASKMRETFRRHDLLARFGGDEFVVFAKDIGNLDTAELCIKRFLQAVEKEKIESIDYRNISISIGAVFFDGTCRTDFDTAYQYCDNAMYSCKKDEKAAYSIVSGEGDELCRGEHQ